jgi:hypothetical protein
LNYSFQGTDIIMDIVPFYFEEWSEEEGYMPTQHIEGYRVLSNEGEVLGWGDTQQEALEAAHKALWRL